MSISRDTQSDTQTLEKFGVVCGKTHPYLRESIDMVSLEVVDAIYGVVTQVPKCTEFGLSPHFTPISAEPRIH